MAVEPDSPSLSFFKPTYEPLYRSDGMLLATGLKDPFGLPTIVSVEEAKPDHQQLHHIDQVPLKESPSELDNRFEVTFTPKEQAKLNRRKAKQTQKILKQRRKALGKHAKVLNRTFMEGEIIKGRKITPGQRLECYQQLRHIEKQMSDLRIDIEHANRASKGKVGRAKLSVTRLLKKSFTGCQSLVGEGRAANLSDGSGLNPINYILDLVDFVQFGMRTKGALSSAIVRKELCKIADSANDRIDEIDRQLPDARVEEQQHLMEEREKLVIALSDLEAEIALIPIEEQTSQSLWQGFGSVTSATNVAFSLASLATILGITHPVLEVAVPAIGVVLVPLTVAMSSIGLGTSLMNVRNARQDIEYAQGIENEKLDQAITEAEDLTEVIETLKASTLEEAQRFTEELEKSQEQISLAKAEIKTINSRLLYRNLPPDEVEALKNQKEQLDIVATEAINHHIEVLAQHLETVSASPQTHPQMIQALNLLKGRQTILTSTKTLNSTITPYIQEKLQVKTAHEYCHSLADMLAISASILAGTGLLTSVFGGTGVPLLMVGAALGMTSLIVRYPIGFLVKKIARAQQGKNRIHTETFNKELIDTMKHEVDNWESLEAAGMVESTTSYHMFQVLKKHYPSMPKHWGPKEWASAIATDSEKGKDRQHLNTALGNMRHHDSLALIRPLFQKTVGDLVKRMTGGRRLNRTPEPHYRRKAA